LKEVLDEIRENTKIFIQVGRRFGRDSESDFLGYKSRTLKLYHVGQFYNTRNYYGSKIKENISLGMV